MREHSQSDIDGEEFGVVTDDAVVLAQLDARFGVTLGSQELAGYAVGTLGLRPTGWREGDPVPPIDAVRDDHGNRVYIWADLTGDDEQAEDDDEPYDDGDPWRLLTAARPASGTSVSVR